MQMKGLMTAMVTPLRDDRVDVPALRALVNDQIDGGVDGLVPCGTTGEAVTLSGEEWDQVVEVTLEVASGRVPVVAGVGSNDTRKTIAAAKRAESLGAQGILVVTPYYNKPTQEGLYRHFRAVAEAVSIDVCVYNVPGRTAVSLDPATLERLLEVPNITGLKEATANLSLASEFILRCGHRIGMLSGDDATTLPFIAVGGAGCISVASNVVPALMARLVHAGLEGRRDEAIRLHNTLFPLFRTLFVESNPIPVKTALAMMGRMTDELRLPLVPMGEANQRLLRAVLDDLGLLVRVA